jgi:hypothetical protein
MLAQSLLVVRRSRKGKILCAVMRERDGANPLRRSAHLGTRYSFERSRKHSHKAWDMCPLVDGRDLGIYDDPQEIDLFVRAVFLRVPLDCMKRPARTIQPPAPADFLTQCGIESYDSR